MIFGCAIEFAVGALCIVLGLIIWLKRKVSLLHDYNYKNVKDEDIPAYSKRMGVGVLLIGTGICLSAVFNLFSCGLWWAPLFAGIAAGLVIMNRAQKKYNGSWFG